MEPPSDELASHRAGRGFTRWFLLTGNRLVISLVVLLGIGAAFFVVEFLGIATVTKATRVMWYLNGTVNGLLTLIPITVGVNQIVLSQEFGSIQDLYDRRKSRTEFRERVEERTGSEVSSPHPATFFGTLLSAISECAGTLQDRAASRESDSELDRETTEIAESIIIESNRANDELSGNDTSMLRTLLVMLFYDNTVQFYDVRRLKTDLADADAETEELEQLSELFYEVDASRQFLKTLVVEQQLARLSRLLVCTGIPAVTIAVVSIFSYRDVAGLTVPRPLLVVIAGTTLVATLVPLAILGAYVLRVATIARQTAAFGPFIPDTSN